MPFVAAALPDSYSRLIPSYSSHDPNSYDEMKSLQSAKYPPLFLSTTIIVVFEVVTQILTVILSLLAEVRTFHLNGH